MWLGLILFPLVPCVRDTLHMVLQVMFTSTLYCSRVAVSHFVDTALHLQPQLQMGQPSLVAIWEASWLLPKEVLSVLSKVRWWEFVAIFFSNTLNSCGPALSEEVCHYQRPPGKRWAPCSLLPQTSEDAASSPIGSLSSLCSPTEAGARTVFRFPVQKSLQSGWGNGGLPFMRAFSVSRSFS